MPTPATATLSLGETRHDVAVPPGTTVAGLLAMLHIDTSGTLTVARTDGSPVRLASIIGADVPSGSMLTITDAAAHGVARVQAARAAHERETWPLATAATLVAVGLAELLAVLVPVLTVSHPLPGPARWAMAALALASVVALASGTRIAHTPGGAVLVPALLGVPVAAVVDPGSPVAGPVAGGVMLVACALAAFVLWLPARRAASSAAALLWGTVALVAVTGLFAGAGPGPIAAVSIVIGVGAVLLAPRMALPVPESQLIDLPLLTTSATQVRAPEVPAPARISRRRVAWTLDHAHDTTATLTLGGVLLSVIAGVPLAVTVDDSLAGRAALATLGCAVAALALVARGHRSTLARTAPRLGAAVLLALVGLLLTWRSVAPLGLIVPALVAIGLMLVGGGVVATREPRSALLGRLADIGQGLALVALLPSAFTAAGLFDLVRQVTS